MTKLIDLTVDRKGHYGIGASSCSYRKEYPEYLRITDISDDGRIIRPLSTSIDIYEYPSYKDYYLNKNDIVFARTGNSTGRNYFYEGDNNKIVYAGFLIKYSLDESLVVPKYVSYYCQSKKFYDVINGNSNGSTRKNFNAKSFGDIEIPMVEHKLQQHIVDTIGSIDDLIEKYEAIINKINEKSLLLVKSKLVTSKKIILKDIIEIRSGKSIKSSDGEYSIIGANGEIGHTTNYNNEGKFLVTGRVGTIGTFTRYNEKCWCSDNTLIIKSKYINYLNYYLNENFDYQAYNRGSTQPLITQGDLLQLEIDFPFEINQLEKQLDLYFGKILDIKVKIKKLNHLKHLYLNEFFN